MKTKRAKTSTQLSVQVDFRAFKEKLGVKAAAMIMRLKNETPERVRHLEWLATAPLEEIELAYKLYFGEE